jgi:cellulose synthase/poly-beta-1,6-N-acetylglucosamine synthase-like glycosyltransferase
MEPWHDFEATTPQTAVHDTSNDVPRQPRIIALVPAHNEEEGIEPAVRSLLAQDRRLDQIIVISDNSTDGTVEIAEKLGVTVIETEGNTYRKSGALNYGWKRYGQDAEIVVCIDGDTRLPPHAVTDWEAEFARNPDLGGSSSQPIMTDGEGPAPALKRILTKGPDPVLRRTRNPLDYLWWLWACLCWRFLPRLQRNEFSRGVQMSLARGWCRVVSGTGCAYRGTALHGAAKRACRVGPWTYESVVEDYHLTYNLRQAGWLCEMSETVWCWTGSMTTLKALWCQRIKWQAGTCGDLLTFGFNRLNYREWFQQGFLFLTLAFWMIWWAVNGPLIAAGEWHFSGVWDLAFPAFYGSMELVHVRRQREKDWKDYLLAGCLVYMTAYSLLATVWGLASWMRVLQATAMGDLWAPQYRAEGKVAEDMKIGA